MEKILQSWMKLKCCKARITIKESPSRMGSQSLTKIWFKWGLMKETTWMMCPDESLQTTAWSENESLMAVSKLILKIFAEGPFLQGGGGLGLPSWVVLKRNLLYIGDSDLVDPSRVETQFGHDVQKEAPLHYVKGFLHINFESHESTSLSFGFEGMEKLMG